MEAEVVDVSKKHDDTNKTGSLYSPIQTSVFTGTVDRTEDPSKRLRFKKYHVQIPKHHQLFMNIYWHLKSLQYQCAVESFSH